jgi:hypothetical protein
MVDAFIGTPTVSTKKKQEPIELFGVKILKPVK